MNQKKNWWHKTFPSCVCYCGLVTQGDKFLGVLTISSSVRCVASHSCGSLCDNESQKGKVGVANRKTIVVLKLLESAQFRGSFKRNWARLFDQREGVL